MLTHCASPLVGGADCPPCTNWWEGRRSCGGRETRLVPRVVRTMHPRFRSTFGFVSIAITSSLAIAGVLAAVLVANSYLEARRVRAVQVRLDRLSDELPARIAQAEAEIRALAGRHPWAGRYQSPEFRPRTLWFAPESGCIVRENCCGGLCQVNWGTIQEDGDMLRVSFNEDDEYLAPHRLPVVFEVQRGGDRRRLQGQHKLRDSWLLEEWGTSRPQDVGAK